MLYKGCSDCNDITIDTKQCAVVFPAHSAVLLARPGLGAETRAHAESVNLSTLSILFPFSQNARKGDRTIKVQALNADVIFYIEIAVLPHEVPQAQASMRQVARLREKFL